MDAMWFTSPVTQVSAKSNFADVRKLPARAHRGTRGRDGAPRRPRRHVAFSARPGRFCTLPGRHGVASLPARNADCLHSPKSAKSPPLMHRFRTFLFDLDGTLIDHF